MRKEKINYIDNIVKVFSYVIKQSLKNNKKYIFLLFPITAIKVLQPFPVLVFPKVIIDSLFIKRNLNLALYYVVFLASSMLILNLLNSVLSSKYDILKEEMKQKYLRDLSNEVMQFNYENLENSKIVEKINRAKLSITGDVDWSSRSLQGNKGLDAISGEFINIITSIFQIFGAVFILSKLNFLIIVVIILVVVINAVTASIKKRSDYNRRKKTSREGDRSNYCYWAINDRAYGKEIRQNVMQSFLLKKYRNARKGLLDARFRNYTTNIKADCISTFANCLQELITYVYLILQVSYNKITIGSFTMYASTIYSLSTFITELINSFLNMSFFSYYLRDYVDIMNMKREEYVLKSQVYEPGNPKDIQFCDVWFKYPESLDYILKGVSITIKKGEKLSVVGENGAGKSTFIKLLLKLYKPQKGKILYGGKDIWDLDTDEYLKCVSAIFQDYKIYSASIKENIGFDEINESLILKALKNVGFEDEIKSFPKGLNTHLTKDFHEDGTEVSGGQGQKLAMARMFYKASGVLVFDEPTASLDPIAEYRLYMNFNRLISNKSAIYISHRLSSSRFCDKIAVFKEGKICEYGSHKDLIKLQGIYHKMFMAQASYYNKEVEEYE